jgi:ParB family chromosome partitioning protein
MFQPDFPTANLHGAAYNPRAIAPDALDRLKASIATIGFAKPIICTQAGLIVAGHQRVKASRAVQRETVPAFVLKEITTYDEIRFNQLHNGTDIDDIDHPVTVAESAVLGFSKVPAVNIHGNLRSIGAAVRKEICRLVLKYGAWGGAVATQSGNVVSGQQYALACKLLGIGCRTFYVPDSAEGDARAYFGAHYGEFSYDHLPRTTWIQTFAQMMRLRNDDSPERKQNASTLYRTMVLPAITKDQRILDFGCGQGDYVRDLRAKGYRIQGVEFFFRKGNAIHPAAVHKMCDDLCRSLRMDGFFDVVVCDSVLNSVDTALAEHDVMVCCNALAKPGGSVFMSGRRMDKVIGQARYTKSLSPNRFVEFADKDGFTALYRKGAWFYQKFHRESEARKLMADWIGPCEEYQQNQSTSFQMFARKTVTIAPEFAIESLRREFNLPWPDGKSVGKGQQIVEAYQRAMAIGGGEA